MPAWSLLGYQSRTRVAFCGSAAGGAAGERGAAGAEPQPASSPATESIAIQRFILLTPPPSGSNLPPETPPLLHRPLPPRVIVPGEQGALGGHGQKEQADAH